MESVVEIWLSVHSLGRAMSSMQFRLGRTTTTRRRPLEAAQSSPMVYQAWTWEERGLQADTPIRNLAMQLE